MQKRNRHPRRPTPDAATRNRCNVPPQDLFLYARSFHAAAKKLAGALEHGSALSANSTPAQSSSCTGTPLNSI